MLVPFAHLPETSRVWIFQADRKWSDTQAEVISRALTTFLNEWTAHGHTLQAAFDLPYSHFIRVGLNQDAAAASGCSIDALFRALQVLTSETGVDFFNREMITFFENGEVSSCKRKDLAGKIAVMGGEGLTFNNLVDSKERLVDQWLVPIKNTWLNRYIAPVSV